MKISDLLSGQPPVRTIPGARADIRKQLVASGKRLIVIDDDPTGIQTVHDVSVFMNWSVEVLRKAILSGAPVFFISTNSRSLNMAEARSISFEVGHNLLQAIQDERVEILLASRSDSTLRGHFPYELNSLASGLGLKPDGVILVPAFFEAGRFTINDIQWVEQSGEVVPVHQTEFARDPVFGFKNSDLKSWVSEKTDGLIKPENVQSITLELLRGGGPEEVEQRLLQAVNGAYIIANAACYADLEILSLAVSKAEAKGKIFAYRCAASFIKARGGFPDQPLLTRRDLNPGKGPGLIVVGSYVQKTSRQLQQLLDSNLVEGIELGDIRATAALANQKLAAGITTVLYSPRQLPSNSDPNFMQNGTKIMESLCAIIAQIQVVPGYVVAKGGSTSIELARRALKVEVAWDLGQILDGVPVLRFGLESSWPGIPYVVFPGNVGGDDALLKVVRTLTGGVSNQPS
jgi:uncharacterized protein YgbK (DUF1537 family)